MGQNRGARGSKKTQAPTRNKKTQDACAKPVLAQAPKGNKETSEEAGKLVHREDHHKGVIGSIDPTSPAQLTRQRWADCSSDSEDEGLWRWRSKAIPELILHWSDTWYKYFVLLIMPFMQDTELGTHKHLIGFDSNGCDREFTWEGNGEPQWARALDKNCFPLVIQGPTTVMLKDLPIDFSPSDMRKLLDGKGFKGKYDLSYLPPGRKAKGSAAKRGNIYQNKAFAFLNMITHEAAVKLIDELTGFTQWDLNSNKVLKVVWADVQGLTRNIQKFRNFSMMEESFPALWRPMLFRDGEQIPFPAPTKLLKPPRHQSRMN